MNLGVPGFESPIRKVAFALTLIKGPEVAEWAKDVGAWVDTLDLVADNIPWVWTRFQDEFSERFADSQKQQTAVSRTAGLYHKP